MAGTKKETTSVDYEKEIKALKAKLKKAESKKEVEDIEISPTKRVKVIHMSHGGTSMQSATSSHRLKGFGNYKNIRFETLENYRFGDYSRLFESRILIIPNLEVRTALDLDEFYDFDIDPNGFKKLANGTIVDMRTALDRLPYELQVSFATYFIDCINTGEKIYQDRNRWNVIESKFNINLDEFVNKD